MIFPSYTKAQKLLSIGILFVGMLIIFVSLCGLLWVQSLSMTTSGNADTESVTAGVVREDIDLPMNTGEKLEILQQLSSSESVDIQVQRNALSLLKATTSSKQEGVPDPKSSPELQVN